MNYRHYRKRRKRPGMGGVMNYSVFFRGQYPVQACMVHAAHPADSHFTSHVSSLTPQAP